MCSNVICDFLSCHCSLENISAGWLKWEDSAQIQVFPILRWWLLPWFTESWSLINGFGVAFVNPIEAKLNPMDMLWQDLNVTSEKLARCRPGQMQRTLLFQAGIGHQVDRDSWYQTTGKRRVKKWAVVQNQKAENKKYKRAGRNQKQSESQNHKTDERINQGTRSTQKNKNKGVSLWLSIKLTQNRHRVMINVLMGGEYTDWGIYTPES